MKKVEWYVRKEGKAEHLVYLDDEGKELQKLLNNEKSMIIRGAAGRKSPLGGRAKEGNIVYFVEKGGNMLVTHRAIISEVIEKGKLSHSESTAIIQQYQAELNLSAKQHTRWDGKAYLGLYRIEHIEAIEPFTYHRENNMDNWIITDDINKIKAP